MGSFDGRKTDRSFCLKCRKTDRWMTDICRICKSETYYAGYTFRVPPKNDNRAWKIIEELIKMKYTLYKCMCKNHRDPGHIPKTMVELRELKKKRGYAP